MEVLVFSQEFRIGETKDEKKTFLVIAKFSNRFFSKFFFFFSSSFHSYRDVKSIVRVLIDSTRLTLTLGWTYQICASQRHDEEVGGAPELVGVEHCKDDHHVAEDDDQTDQT